MKRDYLSEIHAADKAMLLELKTEFLNNAQVIRNQLERDKENGISDTGWRKRAKDKLGYYNKYIGLVEGKIGLLNKKRSYKYFYFESFVKIAKKMLTKEMYDVIRKKAEEKTETRFNE